jgi:hypothetical protein
VQTFQELLLGFLALDFSRTMHYVAKVIDNFAAMIQLLDNDEATG